MIADGLVMNPPRASQENPKQCPLYLPRPRVKWACWLGRINEGGGTHELAKEWMFSFFTPPAFWFPAQPEPERQDKSRRWAGRGDALQFLSLVSNICSGVLSFAIQ